MKKTHKLLFIFIIFTILLVPSYKVNAGPLDWITDIKPSMSEWIPKIRRAIKNELKQHIRGEIEKNKEITADEIRQTEWYLELLRAYPDQAYLFNDTLESAVEELKQELGRYDEDVTECSGIFGDPSDENSTIYMIQKILNYIKVLAPLLVVLLSGIDFSKTVLSGDPQDMKKVTKKLVIRLACAAGVFLAPFLTGFIINFINNTSMDTTCNIK